MAKQLFTNFARTTLSAGIGSGDTSFSVVDGSKFASPTAGDWQVFVIDTGTTFEVCRLTTRSGNTFSVVVRGQESSAASAFSAGASVIGPITAAFVNPLSEIDLTTFAFLNALPATKGGTAQTTYAKGDTLYASAVNTLAKRTIGAANAIAQSASRNKIMASRISTTPNGYGVWVAVTKCSRSRLAELDTDT